jgi:hypothetical protein
MKIYVVIYKMQLTGAGFNTREEAEEFRSGLMETHLGDYPIYEITMGDKMPVIDVIRETCETCKYLGHIVEGRPYCDRIYWWPIPNINYSCESWEK